MHANNWSSLFSISDLINKLNKFELWLRSMRKKAHINYRPYPIQNPGSPPAFLRCKNYNRGCSDVFSNLEDKNKHEISCLADKPDQNPCVLCFFPKDGLFVLLPCGHDSLCESCTIKISSQLFAICPSCRTPITGYKKNYIQVPK